MAIACKRLYLGNVAIYCDLHASSFLGPTAPVSGTTTRHSLSDDAPPMSPQERLEFMRLQCKQQHEINADRDLALISALWLKLDFIRTSESVLSWALGAVDVVTEAIQVNADFTQLTVLNAEVARVTDFLRRTQRHAWRPSFIDRDHVPPPYVTLSVTSVLPIVTRETLATLAVQNHRRAHCRLWLRAMWKYAARCALVAKHKGDAKRVRLGAEDVLQGDALDSIGERYKELYKRSLKDDALKILLFGRLRLSMSPQATTDPKRPQPDGTPLPEYEPLTMSEKWELSDLVQTLGFRDQRAWRNEVAQEVRSEFASYQQVAASNAGEATSPRNQFLHLPTEPTGSGSTSSSPIPSPLNRSISASPSSSPTRSSFALPASFVDGTAQLPPDFVVNHHQQFTRSRANSSPASSPTKHHSISPPSPTGTVHSPLSHAASVPVSRSKPFADGASPTRGKPSGLRPPSSPTAYSKQQWFVESLLPSWLLVPSRVIPLINWYIGPVTLRLHHRATASVDEDPERRFSCLSMSIPPRSPDSYVEVQLDNCTGCALLCKAPSVSFLVELRLGLLKAALVDKETASLASPVHTGNVITTDYIREPSDGFVYCGIKYNFKNVLSGPSFLTAKEHDVWDVKAKLCVGTIHIEYNDMQLQAALKSDHAKRHVSNSMTEFGPLDTSTSIRLESATYLSILHDVLSNWQALVQRVKPHAPHTRTTLMPFDLIVAEQKKQIERATKRARVAKLLNSLMQQSTFVDVSLSGIELQLSVLTSRVVERATAKSCSKALSTKEWAPVPVFDSEQLHVAVPATTAGLENRPMLNESQVYAGGARVKFRTTKHGRAAAIDHIMHRMFPT